MPVTALIPNDIPARRIEFANKGARTIVLATGTEPRHERFALRMQQEFGRDVIGWLRWPAAEKPAAPPPPSLLIRTKRFVKGLIRTAPVPKPASIFLEEVQHLARHAVVEPKTIPANADEFLVQEIERLQPFFFLTLGGRLYSDEVLKRVGGIAINQHAGYSPDYKGNQTTLQALYHRDLGRVASTVHVTTTGADAGPILRRSNPCLSVTDTPQTVAERVVALGTELMIECVHEIRNTGTILAFDQPLTGTTYLSRDSNEFVRARVRSDFESGWLPGALKQRQVW